jgi:hypothetical protein
MDNLKSSLPPFRRAQIEEELHTRAARGDAPSELLSWLGKTEATVAEAIEFLEKELGCTREWAEQAITDHPEWGQIVRSMGGMHGELLEKPKDTP